MPAFENTAAKRLSALKESDRLRVIESSEVAGAWVTRAGKKLLSFCGNDYLGLSQDPRVLQAAEDALRAYGAGAGASRLVTGDHPLYATLEERIAELKNTDAACVFGSGYLANVGLISALAGKDDLILADRLVHACMIDGIKLSGARFQRFKHNDMKDLERLLQHRKDFKECFVLTETVFSMDGDLAPMQEIVSLAKEYDATTVTDDAHGLGIVKSKVSADIQMGTLSKAAGSYGGYVCASKPVIDYLKSSARTLMFSTGLPPSVVAASIASLKIMTQEKNRAKKALFNARTFANLMDLPEAESTIVPLIVGEDKKALEISKKLQNEKFLISAIRPPTVPEGTARLRFTFSALHTDEQVVKLADAVKKAMK